MVEVLLEPNGLPEEVAVQLFQAWVQVGAAEVGLSQYGSAGGVGGHTFSLGSPAEANFVLAQAGLKFSLQSATGIDESIIQSIIVLAAQRVSAHDYGDGVVYLTEMTVESFDIARPLHFMRMLSDQVHIEGERRLSDVVFLKFEEGLLESAPPGGLLFAPQTQVAVTIFSPGPRHSDLTSRLAAGITEITAAICALATGRPVDYLSPTFPAEETAAATALERRGDSSIPGLARDSISLDVFGELQALGGLDAFLRIRGSLLAYHAALKQAVSDVAVMLFVTCIEALISPRAPWGKTKVTQRFIKSLIQLCPEAVDELVQHPDIEAAFGYRRQGGAAKQRREVLDRVYESRSLPTHTGLDTSPFGFSFLDDPSSTRVGLLSDLARAAILSFIQAPRSSVIGHPCTEVPDS